MIYSINPLAVTYYHLAELTRGQFYLAFPRGPGSNSTSALPHNVQVQGVKCLTQLCRIYLGSLEEVLVKKGPERSTCHQIQYV